MAAYRETPWLKRVLIPFWIVRFLLMGFLLAVYIYAVVLATEALVETGSSLTSTLMYAKDDLPKVFIATDITPAPL